MEKMSKPTKRNFEQKMSGGLTIQGETRRHKRIWQKAGTAIIIMLLVFAMLPAGPVQAASQTGEYQKKYKAQVSFPVWIEPAYGVVINRIKNGKVRFQISKAGVNGSPIYNSNIIKAKLKKNKASFQWKDTWGNSGTGKLKLSDGYVKLKVKQTYTAEWNRSTLDTGGKFIKMKKISSNKKLYDKWE